MNPTTGLASNTLVTAVAATEPSPPPAPRSPSTRFAIVGITAMAAMWMYIDRVCFSTLADPIQVDLSLTDREKSRILGAFFLTYALFQIPMGTLADRFGARTVLALSIAAWSGVTAVTGLAEGFFSLLGIRLLLGITEAGAYPAAAGLVKRWARPDERGMFSSAVALGGRVGGAASPSLTSWLAVTLAGVVVAGWTMGPSNVNWRAVFAIYGICGLLVALIFWIFVRDNPPGGVEYPATLPVPSSTAGVVPTPNSMSFWRRMGLIFVTPRMWLFGGLQFNNNVSWAFLITLLPTYLKSRDVPFQEIGNIQTLILLVGCAGMIVGGFVTDGLYRKLGPRWGRSLPIMVVMTGCSAMCLVLTASPVLSVTIAALALLAFCQDFGIPSVWAFAQDIGGKNVGAVLGFGNMLGNLGAAISPIILMEIQIELGWAAAFAFCGAAYILSIACGYMLDATKPLELEHS